MRETRLFMQKDTCGRKWVNRTGGVNIRFLNSLLWVNLLGDPMIHYGFCPISNSGCSKLGTPTAILLNIDAWQLHSIPLRTNKMRVNWLATCVTTYTPISQISWVNQALLPHPFLAGAQGMTVPVLGMNGFPKRKPKGRGFSCSHSMRRFLQLGH